MHGILRRHVTAEKEECRKQSAWRLYTTRLTMDGRFVKNGRVFRTYHNSFTMINKRIT